MWNLTIAYDGADDNIYCGMFASIKEVFKFLDELDKLKIPPYRSFSVHFDDTVAPVAKKVTVSNGV